MCICECGDVGLPALAARLSAVIFHIPESMYTCTHMHKQTHTTWCHEITHTVSDSLSLSHTYTHIFVCNAFASHTHTPPQTLSTQNQTRCWSTVCVRPERQLFSTSSEFNSRVPDSSSQIHDSSHLSHGWHSKTLHRLRHQLYRSAAAEQTGPGFLKTTRDTSLTLICGWYTQTCICILDTEPCIHYFIFANNML